MNSHENGIKRTPPPKKTGIPRILAATKYSYDGLKLAAKTESAFRLELCLFALLAPIAIWFANSGIELLLLIGSMVIVMIVELLNTAIEAVVDRVSSEFHELSRQAKDLGSAAVFLSLSLTVLSWTLILFW